MTFSAYPFIKVAGTLEALLGGYELYHYHSKLMMKEVFLLPRMTATIKLSSEMEGLTNIATCRVSQLNKQNINAQA